MNSCFFELLIFITLRIANLIVQNSIYTLRDPLANLIGTLRRIFGFFFGLYFWNYAFSFIQYYHLLGKNAGINRKFFNVWLAWIVTIYIIIEVLWVIAEVFIHAAKSMNPANRSTTYQEGANPSNTGGNAVQQSYEGFMDEVTFMHMNKNVAVMSPATAFITPLFMLRWAIYTFIAITFYNKVRTCYIIFLGGNLIAVAWTAFALAKGAFKTPNGVLILISEFLVFFAQMSMFINVIDQFGKNSMRQFWVNLNTHIIFWSYFVGTIIEFILLFAPLFGGKPAAMPRGITPSMELANQQAARELQDRVQTYNTMRSNAQHHA